MNEWGYAAVEIDLRTVLAELIASFQTRTVPESFTVTIGFDGFIDEILEVVDKRYTATSYDRIDTIANFGQRILGSAGLSTNIELVPALIKLGGNGPNLANALAALNQQIIYLGALGVPDIDPVFQELVDRCRQVVSFANPGHTDALEFNDGKIMLGKLAPLNEVNWDNLTAKAGADLLHQAFFEADLVATVNWTMIPYMNQIWDQLYRYLSAQEMPKRPYLFVDLADPEKRSREDIREAIGYLEQFSRFYDVILGLNRKEAREVAQALGLNPPQSWDLMSLAEITKLLGEHLNLWGVVVHAVKACAAVCDGVFAEISGPYCAKPKVTTGAGDNFNAGFCFGLLLNLTLPEVLALGSACSGFYVRQGFSANWQQLQDFISLWINNITVSF